MKKRLFWQLFPSYLLIVLISLIMSTWCISFALKQFYISQAESDLQEKAILIETQLSEHFSPVNNRYITKLCKELDQKVSMRVTVLLPSGKVLADSEETPNLMDNHKNRPEIISALLGHIGKSVRYSKTLQKDMMYVSVPVIKNNKVIGIVRAAIPLLTIDKVLNIIYFKIIIEGLIIAFIAILISFFMSKRISKPLEKLELGIKRFTKGDLKHRLHISNTKEIGELAISMNEMAVQLDNKICQIVHQSNEQEVILSSMAEGVIAVDKDEKIIKINRVAAQLIGSNLSGIQGYKIQSVIKNDNLLEFVTKALSCKDSIKEDIIIDKFGEKHFIQAYSTVLQDIKENNIGALIVLNDVTQIRILENIRRDFIANVSHELKTPITSIKGYAETLIDGALDNSDDSKRFVNIILKQADRLNNIIEDLLSLSRLEQDSDKGELITENTKIWDILQSAIQLCTVKAESKNIQLKLLCSDSLQAILSPSLMEQAVVNLIDNAVKYSPSESKVRIEALNNNSEIIINVIDQGCGIPKDHLSRIFERFYRVDKARSRKLGGTGLGLAIVKHISQVNGGYTTVASVIGAGSIFSIHLPYERELN